MQSGQPFCPDKGGVDPGNQLINDYMHAPVASSLDTFYPPGAKHLAPFHGLEFCPSDVCPKNFLVFDQTDNRSQIMFHPGIAHKFSAPSVFFRDTCMKGNVETTDMGNDERESSCPLQEDSDDIDALLSSEDEGEDEYDEEEVSTACTRGNYGIISPDSFSSSEEKRQKMRKMVKTLRGIVPGGDQMNTVAVIDEAVKYLKSLKVEVQKLGVGNFTG